MTTPPRAPLTSYSLCAGCGHERWVHTTMTTCIMRIGPAKKGWHWCRCAGFIVAITEQEARR